MALSVFQFEITSATTGTLNPAFVDLTVDATTGSPDLLFAQIIGYVQTALWGVGCSDVVITNCLGDTLPHSGFTPQAFPAADWPTVVAAMNTEMGATVLGTITDWGQINPALGAGQLPSGRGDSLCVNTPAKGAGKYGRGRHFLPYLTRNVIDSTGLIAPASASFVEHAYRAAMLGEGTGFTSVVPQVWSPTLGTASPVTYVQVNQIPSRLRSRTK